MATVAPKWVIAESVLLAASANGFIRRLLRWRGVSLPPISSVRGATFICVGPRFPSSVRAMSLDAIARMTFVENIEAGAPLIPPEAECLIVFTSGTTGAPKAVVHSRRGLESCLNLVAAPLDISESDVFYVRDVNLIVTALIAGATVVVPPHGHFAPTRVFRDLIRYGVTHMFAVPAECQTLLDETKRSGRRFPPSLKLVITGGAPAHAPFLRRFREVLPSSAGVLVVYGMTEILPVALVTLDDKIKYTGSGDLVGATIPGVRAQVSDEGELLLRGPNLFIGYLGEPPVIEHATGDLARIEGGRIVLLGRRKDMIIRGNYNIYPELYEHTIERIDGVRRCALVGIYDESLADERVVLFVEREHGRNEKSYVNRLRRELREGPCRIDDSAKPDAIHIMELPQIGRSSKVDKNALRRVARRRTLCA